MHICIYTRTHTQAPPHSLLSHTYTFIHTYTQHLTHTLIHVDTRMQTYALTAILAAMHTHTNTPRHFSCTPTLILSHFTPQSWTNKPGLAIGIITDACRAVDERVRVGILMAFNAQPLTTGPQIALSAVRVYGADTVVVRDFWSKLERRAHHNNACE